MVSFLGGVNLTPCLWSSVLHPGRSWSSVFFYPSMTPKGLRDQEFCFYVNTDLECPLPSESPTGTKQILVGVLLVPLPGTNRNSLLPFY